MNAQLIKKEVESICNRKIAKLRNASRLIYNGRAISKLNQQIRNLQDLRYRWVESSFLDRCQQRIREELQEQHDCHWR